MDESDIIYKAIKDYRSNTEGYDELSRFRDAVVADRAEESLLSVTRNICEIDEEWIDEIEKGLVFVAAALAEERQFIQSNGEIIPIERVRRVSKDSIEHLAKHSSLVTREPKEGSDLIPEKLYTVERLSDFTVYENKFLYMLLAYVHDFVTYRYEKIIDHTYTYKGKLALVKDLSYRNRKIKFTLSLDEERKKDKFLKELNPIKSTIGRIEKILSDVNFYLSLPIMQEVAKAPIIKPPITKTNVLRMNKHFKGAVALYEYINSYTKEGFHVVPKTDVQSPLTDGNADAFSELLVYSSFLSYEYNLNLGDVFKRQYEAELQRLKIEEEKRETEKLKNLRKRIASSGMGMEEYMLILEERLKTFDAMRRDLEAARADIEKLTQDNGVLTAAVDERNKLIADARAEIRGLIDKNIEDIQRLNAEHASALEAKDAEKAEALKEANRQSEMAISSIRDAAARERESVAQRIAEINKQNAEKTAQAESAAREKVFAAQNAASETEARLCAAEKDLSELRASFTDIQGRLNALRAQHGLIESTEDYTTEDSFDEIEKQYKAFTAFYKKEWQKTKKRIRRETLSMENVKKEAKRKKGEKEPVNETERTDGETDSEL
ncbi:MAG: DUF2357 domain-containing protein [Clostridiales bacterium]|nr:DUF2357 domain-containing protein [Clostridiales bacterium]